LSATRKLSCNGVREAIEANRRGTWTINAVTGNSGEAATKIYIQMTPLPPAAMKWRKGLRGGVGLVLCVVGFMLARTTVYREITVVVNAGGCRLVTDVIDQGNDDVRGYVVLYHGLAANKKIMAYLARGFANQNMRVFVPDLPGHGRTPGPFSFERAESCAGALVQELSARRAIDLQRTMLAGHSMGGAIAIRVAARVGVAGVIGISPAPMRAAHGVPGDMLPYTNPPPVPPHTLAISAAFEPLGIRELTRDLITGAGSESGKYLFMPRATHVSVLFDRRVLHAAQEWTAETLHFPVELSAPSNAHLVGALAGLTGILLIAGPFVRETVGVQRVATAGAALPEIGPGRGAQAVGLRGPAGAGRLRPALQVGGDASSVPFGDAVVASQGAGGELTAVPVLRALLEVAAVSFVAVTILRFWNPLSFVRVYNGSYFASFLLILGVGLLLIHHKSVRALFPIKINILLLALVAGFVLHLLVTGWLDLTLTEAWLSWARWARVPVVFAAAFAYLLAEELLLGPISGRRKAARFLLAFVLRLIAFLVLVFGIFVLHSGAILIFLLSIYLALFFVLQRLGMDIVRQQTESPIAAAVFGAILLAGFCLVIFPVT
jgi:pimeloyl-ACP methyl ester carboxylesterase